MEVEEESKETFTTKSADDRLIAEADLASKRLKRLAVTETEFIKTCVQLADNEMIWSI